MKSLLASFFFLTASLLVVGTLAARADTFGSGENSFEIEFVPVTSEGEYSIQTRLGTFTFPGNRPDRPVTREIGNVPYGYRMGQFEISESMIDAANALGDLGITHDNRGPDKPVTSVSWFDAAQFVDWLN